MTDSVGMSEYEYDEQDRLISYTPPAPSGHASVEYAYNNLGQKTEVSTTGLGLTYEYFANGWLKAVKLGNDVIATYEYDEVGNRTGINLGNGTHTVYDYDGDPRYRIDSIEHYYGQTLLGSISYPSRDGSGNPLSMIDSSGQIAYDYDMNSRLIEAGAANYSYDWVGNRLVPGSPQYNNADQLESGFGHTYNYDGRGNMIESVGANGRTYTYTPANLLSSVTHDEVQGTPTSSMTWDADSNRVSFSSSEGGTWQFVYDITAGIPAVIEEEVSGASVYYIREPNGALIARISGSDVHYYHFDALGSTRLLTDDSGDVTDQYSYDAWGNVTDHTGSTAQPYQFVGRLGYYTHWQDENLDLLQLGVRFYDPEVGRFTQVDPIRLLRDSAYSYVKNSPVRRTDPSGLQAEEEPGDTRIPELVPHSSCDTVAAMDGEIEQARKYARQIIEAIPLKLCPPVITIRCHGRCRVLNRNRCGFAMPHTGVIHVHDWWGCPRAMCVILHELVHACGVTMHDWVGIVDATKPKIPCDFSRPYEDRRGH